MWSTLLIILQGTCSASSWHQGCKIMEKSSFGKCAKRKNDINVIKEALIKIEEVQKR